MHKAWSSLVFVSAIFLTTKIPLAAMPPMSQEEMETDLPMDTSGSAMKSLGDDKNALKDSVMGKMSESISNPKEEMMCKPGMEKGKSTEKDMKGMNMPNDSMQAVKGEEGQSKADEKMECCKTLKIPLLSKLELGGTVQLKGLYHKFTSDQDADKSLSLNLRRFKMDLDGAVDKHFGFKGGFLMDGNNRAFGIDDGYLYYTMSNWVGFKGGKMKRPFSQEALASSKSLYTIERGELYFDFLANTTGYAYYDIGLLAYGGFTEDGRTLGYEIGIFNGKQNHSDSKDYSGQHYETTDKGFIAKDFVMRVTAEPMKDLKIEAAVSTKAAEDTTDANNFKYNVNTGYEVGLGYHHKNLNLQGEVSWGDNHNGVDKRILSGSTRYFAFYALAVWREEYSQGRASESVIKVEGLDPDFGAGKNEGKPNDGILHYTFGMNYFFNPRVSLLTNYGLIQPVTKVVGNQKIDQNLEMMWRLTF